MSRKHSSLRVGHPNLCCRLAGVAALSLYTENLVGATLTGVLGLFLTVQVRDHASWSGLLT